MVIAAALGQMCCENKELQAGQKELTNSGPERKQIVLAEESVIVNDINSIREKLEAAPEQQATGQLPPSKGCRRKPQGLSLCLWRASACASGGQCNIPVILPSLFFQMRDQHSCM